MKIKRENSFILYYTGADSDWKAGCLSYNPQVVKHYDALKVGDLVVINIEDEFEDPSG